MDISDALLHRFDWFNDAVVETVSIDWSAGPGSQISIRLHCKDDNDPRKERKSCVIEFQGVAEFNIAQAANTTLTVVSFGIAVVLDRGLTYLDFACDGFRERTIDEIRSGGFYIAARKVGVSVL